MLYVIVGMVMVRRAIIIILGAIIIILCVLAQGKDFLIPTIITTPCAVILAAWPLLKELYLKYIQPSDRENKLLKSSRNNKVNKNKKIKEFIVLMGIAVVLVSVIFMVIFLIVTKESISGKDQNSMDLTITEEHQNDELKLESVTEQQSNELELERKSEQQSDELELERKSEQQSNELDVANKNNQKTLSEKKSETNSSITEQESNLVEQNQQKKEENSQQNNNIYGMEKIYGKIIYKNQEDRYEFIPEVSGVYRFDVSELLNDTCITLSIEDEFGNSIGYKWIRSNNDGITLTNAEAEQKYVLIVKQVEEFSEYTISIGYQKPTEVLAEQMEGEITYKEQVNNYKFVPMISGLYRLDFQDIISGTTFQVKVLDRLGYVLNYKYISNDDGITIPEMIAGEEYKIEVKQYSGKSKYIMRLGAQKPILDISNMLNVGGEIIYKDQQDIYTFVPSVDASYEFSLSEIIQGTQIRIKVIDRLGYCVKERIMRGGDSIIVQEMVVGEEYKIILQHYSGYSIYIMSINTNQS